MILDLSELLETQKILQAKMGDPTGYGEEGFKENILHVVVETIEALRETNFKPWKAEVKKIDRVALATEMTDVLQFWANAANCMGLSAEDLTSALRAKWVENNRRTDSGETAKQVV